MVRKNAIKAKSKKTASKPIQNDPLDYMLGSEVTPEKNMSSKDRPSPPTPQEFSILTASQSPRRILDRRPRSLLVTGSTSTVPNTSRSLSHSSDGGVSEDSAVYEAPSSLNGYLSATEEQQKTSSSNSNRRKSSVPNRKSSGVNPKSQSENKTVPNGAKALQEIAHVQTTTKLLIPKLPFARLIREVLLQYCDRDLRITADSLMCLQEAAEIYAVQLMEDGYRCTLHRDRNTLMPKDMRLALMLRKDSVML